MWARKDYSRSSQEKGLEELLRKYAKGNGNTLDKDQLRNVFQQLGALMPFKHAEEAFKVADKNKDNLIKTDEEFRSLIEYAINNGFSQNSY